MDRQPAGWDTADPTPADRARADRDPVGWDTADRGAVDRDAVDRDDPGMSAAESASSARTAPGYDTDPAAERLHRQDVRAGDPDRLDTGTRESDDVRDDQLPGGDPRDEHLRDEHLRDEHLRDDQLRDDQPRDDLSTARSADPGARAGVDPGPAGVDPGPAGVGTGPAAAGTDLAGDAGPSADDPARRSGAQDDPAAVQPSADPERLVARDRAESYGMRWSEVKGEFVDDPRQAVARADALVGELLDELQQLFAQQRRGLEQGLDNDDVSTEELRVALRRYRSFFDRLLSV